MSSLEELSKKYGFDSDSPSVGEYSDGINPIWKELAQGQDDGWQWDPGGRIRESWKETIGTILGAGAMVSSALGYEEGKVWLSQKAGEKFEEAAALEIDHTVFKEIDSPLDFATWTTEVITKYLPDFGLMALSGVGIGTFVGRVVAKKGLEKTVRHFIKSSYKKNLSNLRKKYAQKEIANKSEFLTKQAAKMTARDTGALLGAASVEGVQSAGQNFLEQLEERGENANPWASMGVGIGVTAIGMLSPITRGVAGAVSGKLPSRISAGKLAGITIGEFAEEAGQEFYTMAWEAGLDPNKTFGEILASEEGQMRLLESGVAGAVLGLTFGGGVKLGLDKFKKKQPISEEEQRGALESIGVNPDEDADPPSPPPPPGSLPGWGGALPVEKQTAGEGGSELDNIFIPYTVMDAETGKPVEIEIAASELEKRYNNDIEKWYWIKACMGL